MYIHFILYFLRTIKGGLHGIISEIKTQYITIPGTAVLSCQYENDPALRWWKRGSIISQDTKIDANYPLILCSTGARGTELPPPPFSVLFTYLFPIKFRYFLYNFNSFSSS
jgi:hypothetical protein